MKFAWTDAKKRDAAALALAERVEMWAKRLAPLGIAHFQIDAVHVDEATPGGPHAKAAVQCSRDYDHCTFWFKREFLDYCSGDELDQTILHEWVHVAMRDYDRTLEVVERWMPEATYEDFDSIVNSEREGLVDRLAHALFLAFSGHSARFQP